MDTTTDTRQRIINSARDLVFARSYSEVGVQEICRTAGVQKGSFYHFFPSKRDLTLAVLDQLAAYFRNEVLGKAFAKDIPPLQRINRFFEMLYSGQSAMKAESGQLYGCPFGNLACEMSTQDEAIRKKIDHFFQEAEQPIAETLTEAVEQGDLPAIDPVASARAIFAYAEGIMLVAKTRNDPEVLRELGSHALQLVIPATVP